MFSTHFCLRWPTKSCTPISAITARKNKNKTSTSLSSFRDRSNVFTIAFKPKKQEYLTHNAIEKTHAVENYTPSFTSKLTSVSTCIYHHHHLHYHHHHHSSSSYYYYNNNYYYLPCNWHQSRYQSEQTQKELFVVVFVWVTLVWELSHFLILQTFKNADKLMLHCLKVATKSHLPTPFFTFSKDVNVILQQVRVEVNHDESHLLELILFAELVKHELSESQKSSQHLARASHT